jgi:GNAT superfamily N-acetyltransferase
VAAPTPIRAAGQADIAGMRAILVAHGEDAPPLPGHPDIIGPYLHHLVANHRVLVVDDGAAGGDRGGGIVAFGAVLDTGRCRMLSDLFVTPSRLGQGLGQRLLAELFEDAPRRATFASADPRALPLYVRSGMAPLWVCLYVQGDPATLKPLVPTPATRAATAAECASLEHAWTGADRPIDHGYFASGPHADVFVVEDEAGEPVAFAYARAKQASSARALDRLLVRPGADPVAPIIAGLLRAGGGHDIQACIPGPNPILPILLDHGFRIVDQDQHLASHPDIVDPARFLPNPGLL